MVNSYAPPIMLIAMLLCHTLEVGMHLHLPCSHAMHPLPYTGNTLCHQWYFGMLIAMLLYHTLEEGYQAPLPCILCNTQEIHSAINGSYILAPMYTAFLFSSAKH
jgi:hypothetical protein